MRRLLITLTYLLLFFFAFVARPTVLYAKAFEVRDDGWEGGSEFLALARAELGNEHVVPIAELDWSVLKPHDSIILIHPERAPASERLAAFLNLGGRVAILDDFGAADRTLARFGIEKAPPPTRPVEMLRDRAELALAEPVADGPTANNHGVHPSVVGVDRVVLNHPTALRSAELTPVLKVRVVDGPDAIVAFAGEPKSVPSRNPPGKLLAMSDPSALINEMLRYPGNRAFAIGLVRYLGHHDERNSGKLYLLTNDFTERGSLASTGLQSELNARVETLRSSASHLAGEGFSGPLGWALGTLLAAGLCWLGVGACSKLRAPPLPRFASAPPLVAQGGLAGRAAVLSAPSTPAALLMLELKRLLEAELLWNAERQPARGMEQPGTTESAHDAHSDRFGGPRASSLTLASLVAAIEKRHGLDESSRAALKEILRDMSNAETQIVKRQAEGIGHEQVEQAARTIARILGRRGADTKWTDP